MTAARHAGGMKTSLRKLAGAAAVLAGLGTAGAVAWRLWAGDPPRRPLRALGFGLGLALLGAGLLAGTVGGGET